MGGFYHFVVFKNQECFDEMQKCRQAANQKRVMMQNKDNFDSSNNEKGIIISKFDPKKKMEIVFINKSGLKLT